jgi:hypothetical protein
MIHALLFLCVVFSTIISAQEREKKILMIPEGISAVTQGPKNTVIFAIPYDEAQDGTCGTQLTRLNPDTKKVTTLGFLDALQTIERFVRQGTVMCVESGLSRVWASYDDTVAIPFTACTTSNKDKSEMYPFSTAKYPDNWLNINVKKNVCSVFSINPFTASKKIYFTKKLNLDAQDIKKITPFALGRARRGILVFTHSDPHAAFLYKLTQREGMSLIYIIKPGSRALYRVVPSCESNQFFLVASRTLTILTDAKNRDEKNKPSPTTFLALDKYVCQSSPDYTRFALMEKGFDHHTLMILNGKNGEIECTMNYPSNTVTANLILSFSEDNRYLSILDKTTSSLKIVPLF